VLDVGCGPGGLTGELARRVGGALVAAIDPSPPFVEACRARHPQVDARVGVAEDLPYGDGVFDATLACLVVGFMSDAHKGIQEMARVTKPGGTIAACFWDVAQMPAIQTFWHAAAELDPARKGEVARLGSREGDLTALLANGGLRHVHETALWASSEYQDFEDWWGPIAQGVGPAGVYYLSLDAGHREALRRVCKETLGDPDGSFVLEARAWCASGTR
jgi:SAM-dependent methyltransferase